MRIAVTSAPVPRYSVAGTVSLTATAPAIRVGQTFHASMRRRAIGATHSAIRVGLALDAGERGGVANVASALEPHAIRVALTLDTEPARRVAVGPWRRTTAAHRAFGHARVRVEVTPERRVVAVRVRHACDAASGRSIAIRRTSSAIGIGGALDALMRRRVAGIAISEVRAVCVPHALDAYARARVAIRIRGAAVPRARTRRRCSTHAGSAPRRDATGTRAAGTLQGPAAVGGGLIATATDARKEGAHKGRNEPRASRGTPSWRAPPGCVRLGWYRERSRISHRMLRRVCGGADPNF